MKLFSFFCLYKLKVRLLFFIRFLTTGDSYSNCLAGDNLVKFWIKDPNITAYQDISQRECAYVFGDRIEKNTCDIRYIKRLLMH